ncbi:hypothetical protein IU449_16425 [Nocardia higoensis]|uniref:Holin n=1 Tax=Nocardia higoensis TaxID=228599 RepID=A0ABS0DC93_9NOCA|nr:hypothetical protein [Nocardia higoensis]MBF6356108.1 hypothetical protein [Nocardia higoensis]
MNVTMKSALGVSIGAATGFTAYELWARSRDGSWPDGAAAWLTVAVTALVVGIVTAIVYHLVLGLRERRARGTTR